MMFTLGGWGRQESGGENLIFLANIKSSHLAVGQGDGMGVVNPP